MCTLFSWIKIKNCIIEMDFYKFKNIWYHKTNFITTAKGEFNLLFQRKMEVFILDQTPMLTSLLITMNVHEDEGFEPKEGNSHQFVPRSGDVVEFSKLFKLGFNGTVKLLFSFLWPLNIEAGPLWAKQRPVTSHVKPWACHSEHRLLYSRILEYSMTAAALTISEQMGS